MAEKLAWIRALQMVDHKALAEKGRDVHIVDLLKYFAN
jgi:hypothetical protein